MKTIGDLIWVWGPIIKDAGLGGVEKPEAGNFVEASVPQKADLLGVRNIILAGHGLPESLDEALTVTESVKAYDRLVWEISSDDGMHKPPFSYQKTIERLTAVVEKYPHVEGVLLDDMTSMSMDAGFGVEHLRAVRAQLPQSVKLWGVVYTMNYTRPGIDAVIENLDVISLWVWHARELDQLETNLAVLEAKFPDKPIVLGLYLYDYGDARPMPQVLLEMQAATALKLAHERRIEGIVFITINNDSEAVQWTMDWIKEVSSQPIGK